MHISEEDWDFLITLLALIVMFQLPALLPCAATPRTSQHQTRRGGDLGGVHDTRGYVKSARTLTCRPLML